MRGYAARAWERGDGATAHEGVARQISAIFKSGDRTRHLRRMRTEYRRRRDLLVEALGDALPEARIHGIAAGLHATVELPAEYDERAMLEQARARRIDMTTMGEFWIEPGSGPPTLLVGYGQLPEPAVGAAVTELAEATLPASTFQVPAGYSETEMMQRGPAMPDLGDGR